MIIVIFHGISLRLDIFLFHKLWAGLLPLNITFREYPARHNYYGGIDLEADSLSSNCLQNHNHNAIRLALPCEDDVGIKTLLTTRRYFIRLVPSMYMAN